MSDTLDKIEARFAKHHYWDDSWDGDASDVIPVLVAAARAAEDLERVANAMFNHPAIHPKLHFSEIYEDVKDALAAHYAAVGALSKFEHL